MSSEFLKAPDSLIDGFPIGLAIVIFESDNWPWTVPVDTYRGVKYTITQREDGGHTMNVSWTRIREDGYIPIKLEEVVALGPNPTITVVQLCESQGLLASCLFSFDKNINNMKKFAEFWLPLPENVKMEILEKPDYIKAAFMHFCWLNVNTKGNLNEAYFDKVTTAAGLHYPFPSIEDIINYDFVNPQDNYVSSYIKLWNNIGNIEKNDLAGFLHVDLTKFYSYLSLLEKYPEYFIKDELPFLG